MRLQHLKPGMRCYLYGRYLATVLEVVASDPDAGIQHPYALLQDEEGKIRMANGHALQSVEQVEQRKRQQNNRTHEIQQMVRQIGEHLPSFGAVGGYHADQEMKIWMDEADCLKVLEVCGAKAPANTKLPSHRKSLVGDILDVTTDGLYQEYAVLLARRVRRAIGPGRCSQYGFPRQWTDGGQAMMYMTVDDQGLHDLLDRLGGNAEPGSALAELLQD